MTRVITLQNKAVLIGIILVLWTAAPMSAIAQKTDVLTLYSGDTITGEIKSLARGKLEFSTHKMSTIYIEWTEIADIQSDKVFEIQLSSIQTRVVKLQNSEENGVLSAIYNGEPVSYPMITVTDMTRLKGSFWQRLYGSAQLGANLVKANNERQYNFDGKLQFRSAKIFSTASVSSYVNLQDERDPSTRQNGAYDINRLFKHGWALGLSSKFESNDETGLESRVSLGFVGSKEIIQTNHSLFYGYLGAQSNTERYASNDVTSQSAEGTLSLTYEHFSFRDPKLDFRATASAYPSITEANRLRTGLSAQITYEIISDLKLGLNGYIDTDNQPADGFSGLDYGVFTSAGYSFH